MINIKPLNINNLDDYNKLINREYIHDPIYIDLKLVEELKTRVGLRCSNILIEYPYRDFDFSST